MATNSTPASSASPGGTAWTAGILREARDVAQGQLVLVKRIADDVASADAGGVAGTPSLFVNGRRDEGAYDAATLSEVVRSARTRASAMAAAAAAPTDPPTERQ